MSQHRTPTIVLLTIAVFALVSCRSDTGAEVAAATAPPETATSAATAIPSPDPEPAATATSIPAAEPAVTATTIPHAESAMTEAGGCTARSDLDLSGHTMIQDFWDDPTVDPSPAVGDFDGDGLPDVAAGWLHELEEYPVSVLTVHTGAGGFQYAELPLFPIELRTVRLVGWEKDVLIASTVALHGSSHDVYIVHDCVLVHLGPHVPWGGGQFDDQLICLDDTDDGAILSTYYRELDQDSYEIIDERNASWIIESGVLVETDLIERDLRGPDFGCFDF